MKKIYNYFKALGFLAAFGAAPLAAQTYCTSNAISTYDDEIFNVTLGTLNNTSSCGQLAGGAGSIAYRYSNYTTVVPAPNLLMGNNYPLSVTGGQCNGFTYCGYIYVWIDYNQNGSFTDPGRWFGPQIILAGRQVAHQLQRREELRSLSRHYLA